jgi:hypothetical protein
MGVATRSESAIHSSGARAHPTVLEVHNDTIGQRRGSPRCLGRESIPGRAIRDLEHDDLAAKPLGQGCGRGDGPLRWTRFVDRQQSSRTSQPPVIASDCRQPGMRSARRDRAEQAPTIGTFGNVRGRAPCGLGSELRCGSHTHWTVPAPPRTRYHLPGQPTGPWGNGSPTDSGSVSPGSNPGGPAPKAQLRGPLPSVFAEGLKTASAP